MFNITRSPLILSIVGLLLSPLVLADFSHACSRILWNINKQAVVVARSMDWSHPFGERLVIYPRGTRMQGMPGENPATWVSKYGSIGVVPYGLNQSILNRLMGSGDPANQGDPLVNGNAEGINEKGLAAHALALVASNYGTRDQQKPGVSTSEWVRYVLDNFETVKDAVAGLQAIQIVCAKVGDVEYPQHMALEDPTGDSAIIEIIDGKMVIHHGREYTVMTNDPPYPVHLANLKRYKSFGGTIEELPGGNEPNHRFVRGMEFLRTLPEPEDQPEAIAYLYSVIHNVSVPYGAVYHSLPGSPTYPTWWTSATDLTNRIFYFHETHSQNTIRVTLKEVDFTAGRPMSVLDPAQIDLVGDVTNEFLPVAASVPASQ
jgi:penicillin V acylase-like amidase (Ntn superfamily)